MSDGFIFHLDSTYTVAINSYRGSGGGGHLTRGAGIPKEELSKRILTSTDKDFRFYMTNWIEETKNIDPKIISTWKIIPEGWWEKGRKKDYKFLFGTEAPVLEKQTVEFDYK
jgi:2',3'-cyclic-nucleotide 2'-phosphodiesterase/3'-nucleotidase